MKNDSLDSILARIYGEFAHGEGEKMTDGDDALVFSGIASNTRNPLTRPVEMTEDEVRDAMFDSGCVCSGECECWVEPDGECPYGWPSKLRAIGLI